MGRKRGKWGKAFTSRTYATHLPWHPAKHKQDSAHELDKGFRSALWFNPVMGKNPIQTNDIAIPFTKWLQTYKIRGLSDHPWTGLVFWGQHLQQMLLYKGCHLDVTPARIWIHNPLSMATREKDCIPAAGMFHVGHFSSDTSFSTV